MENRNLINCCCCCCCCKGCWFYSTTWRMISRSAGCKIHFRKQPPFRGNFFPCLCDIFRFFEFILLGNSSTAPVFSYNQINKQLKNLNVNYRECFGYFTARIVLVVLTMRFFILMKKLKTPSSFEIIGLRPSFSDEGTFFVRAREKTMETVCWRCPRKLRFQERKSHSRARVSGNRWNTDILLLRTVFFVPGESPYIFSKFNPLYTDTR